MKVSIAGGVDASLETMCGLLTSLLWLECTMRHSLTGRENKMMESFALVMRGRENVVSWEAAHLLLKTFVETSSAECSFDF